MRFSKHHNHVIYFSVLTPNTEWLSLYKIYLA